MKKVKNRNILIFLLVSFKLLLLFVCSMLASQFLSYRGHFSFPDILNQFNIPEFILSFANFDGIHYIRISTEGYYKYSQAFFPFYPLLINLLTIIFWGNRFWTGFFISNTSFFAGLLILKKILKKNNHENKFFWMLLFILAFPTSFFFHMLYTESLFFMLFMLTLFFLQEKKYLQGGIVAAAASATRLVGTFLFIPFVFSLLPKLKRSQIVFSLFPFLGLLTYMVYLLKMTGDSLAFITVQPSFGAGRSTHLIFLPQVYFRYIKIFFMSKINFQYFIALLEFATFNFVAFACLTEAIRNLKRKDYFYLSIAIFSLVNIILPTLTGTFLSIPRFALLSISTFFFLANLKNYYLKVSILIFFSILQVILFTFFIQGYFVS